MTHIRVCKEHLAAVERGEVFMARGILRAAQVRVGKVCQLCPSKVKDTPQKEA